MPNRDPDIPLCGSCLFRPICRETGGRVPGLLRITTRQLPDGAPVAVVYSLDDPGDNVAHRFTETSSPDTSLAVQLASSCAPIVEGLALHTYVDNLDVRIAAQQRDQTAHCRIGRLLVHDQTLPPNLLYQTQKTD